MTFSENTLEKIHFTPENGLVLCDRLPNNIHISERYHIHEKARKLGATAVLFRRKYNDSNEVIDSKPSLYIYEKDNTFFNTQEHLDLQAKIWSAGDIEVYILVSATRIDIINARKPAQLKDNKLDTEELRLISQTLEQFNDQRFSALIFGRGSFWEQEDFFDDGKETFYKNQLNTENTPFQQLLNYLTAIREDLHKKRKELSVETIDKLLIVCILIKFLEEIRDDGGTHTLREIYDKHGINDFAEALDKGLCLSILKQLRGKFKGNIFDIFSDKEEQFIEGEDLSLIADFLRAKYDPRKNQYFLWQQYSFNYLPVELISAIYENFLPKEKGVVYTPPLLVNFLIDEVMPLNKANEYFSKNNFKVLDPSCGSGVFLVAAYKRMLQWWSINEYYTKGESHFSKPDKAICQEILQKNIFGVDINKTATLITLFSLTIALLDKLEPKEIWNNLELNNLQENIQTRNFFEWATEHKKDSKTFDLVMGNPPFNRSSTKKESISEYRIQEFGLSSVPGNDLALKFFEWAMFFGQCACLILPSNVLLYRREAQKYRTCIFTEFSVKKIFDFTHLRRHVLFGSAEISACAILASSEKSQGQNIEHIVVKRLTSIEKKLFFEIDHYDYHVVPHNWAIDPTKQFVWKTNLLGGGRLFHLIYRLSLLENLATFIKNKKHENNWVYNNGYIGQYGDIDENKQAIFLNGKPQIKAGTFDEFGNFETEIIPETAYFWNTRTSELYQSPHIVFKLVIEKSNIPMAFSDDYLCFNSSFVGIHAPLSDRDELYKIYDRLHKNKITSNLYQVFILATTPKAKVYHETSIVKEDIDNLPYPDDGEYLTPSLMESILIEDVLQYYVHLGKAISKDGKVLHKRATLSQLEKFGQIFCDTLNPIYAKNGKSWQYGNFYQTHLFTICQLGYGKNGGLSSQAFTELDDTIKPLIYNTTSHRGAIFTRVCRIYKHVNGYDCVFLIKPHAIRYWLGSIALRDADETFVDLKKNGR